MSKHILGCDIDGVIADFVGGFINAAADLGLDHRLPPTRELWTSWMTPDQGAFGEVWDVVKNDHSFWLNLGLEPNVNQYMLSRMNVDHFVTARPVPSEVTAEWLGSWGLSGVPVTTVDVHSTKASELMELGITEFIEDKYENFMAINEAGIKCWLVTTPANERSFIPEQYQSLRIDDLTSLFPS